MRKIRLITLLLLAATVIYLASLAYASVKTPHISVQQGASPGDHVLYCHGEVIPTENETEWIIKLTGEKIEEEFKGELEQPVNIYVQAAIDHCRGSFDEGYVIVPEEEWDKLPVDYHGVYKFGDSYYSFMRYISSSMYVELCPYRLSHPGLWQFIYPEGSGIVSGTCWIVLGAYSLKLRKQTT